MIRQVSYQGGEDFVEEVADEYRHKKVVNGPIGNIGFGSVVFAGIEKDVASAAPNLGVLAMELDRHRYFVLGVILFLLGIQFRMVDSLVLNESSTKMLYKVAKRSQLADSNLGTQAYMQMNTKKSIDPPDWLGWALLSAGTVICLHSFAMPKKK